MVVAEALMFITTMKYEAPRKILVDIWQIGLLYRLGWLGALAYVSWGMFGSGSYSYSVVPLGSVNA